MIFLGTSLTGFPVCFDVMLCLLTKDQLGTASGKAVWANFLSHQQNKFYLQNINNSVVSIDQQQYDITYTIKI